MNESDEDIRDIIDHAAGILKRRRWWIGISATCVVVAVAAATMLLPKRFVSEATLVVVQQQVSQRYVDPDNPSVVDSLQSLTQDVLSSSRLLEIIQVTGRYRGNRAQRSPEVLVQRMRQDIIIQPLGPATARDISSFSISFGASDPQLARRVTSRLTSFFIEENSKAGETRAAVTTDFLAEQLAVARNKLAQEEQLRRNFQTSNLTELPQQQQRTFEAMAELRAQMQSLRDHAERQRVSLETSLNERMERLQSEKSALLARFTSQYPEVGKKDQQMARIAGVLAEMHSDGVTIDPPKSPEQADDPSAAALLARVRAYKQEAENLAKEESRLRAELARYESRLNLVPVREQQLAEISRNSDLYAQGVRDAETKLRQAQQTASLQERQEGQRFRLIDPPTLPLEPSSPNRLKFSLWGGGGGFALGFLLAFLIDSRDRSLHSEKEAKSSFALPLVLGIPLFLTPGQQRFRRFRKGFEWLAAAGMVAAVLATELFVFNHG
jgi:succinoglycan biosynthesis transport protein ExoP